MSRSVGVVVPAYRPDPALLAQYVRDLDEHVEPAAIRVELDVPTESVLDRLADVPATVDVKVTVSRADRRRGKGAAITAGFEALDTDVLAFADADGSTPAASMADVVSVVRTGDAPMAVGSRRHPDATIRSHQTFVRQHFGDIFAALARATLGVDLYDFQCGAKALTRDVWTDVREHIYETGFAWDIELIAIASALGYRIEEVPVVWEDHPDSTVSTVETSLRFAKTLLSLRRRTRRLRREPRRRTSDPERPPIVEQLSDRPSKDE